MYFDCIHKDDLKEVLIPPASDLPTEISKNWYLHFYKCCIHLRSWIRDRQEASLKSHTISADGKCAHGTSRAH